MSDTEPDAGRIEGATLELLGALAYGQLRSFEAAARSVRVAPDVRRAERAAAIAVAEHGGYQSLRDHLVERGAGEEVFERQRTHFDRYFDHAPLDDWFDACVFFALGLPLAADFARAVAPALDDEAARLVVGVLGDKDELEREAVAALAAQLTDDEARERARSLTADLLGRALTGFQGVTADSDALKVLLAGDTREGESGEQRVKRLVIDVMSGHRRRAVELGLEDLDDVW